MSSAFKLLKDNGSLPLPLKSSFNAPAPPPPTPNVTFAWISVTMGSSVPCLSVLPVENWHRVMRHIIVWKPNVISVIDGDIPMRFAIFGSAEDVMPQGTWSITARSICLPSQTLEALMGGPIWTTMTSTPLWMTTREMVYIKPGARMYEGGNVTIFFLSHVFFLVIVVCHPYTSLLYMRRVTITYLPFHAFPIPYSYRSSIPFHYRTISSTDYLSHNSHVSPTFHKVLQPSS